MSSRPELAALAVADPPERWEALGFEVERGVCALGGVAVTLGADGKGIVSWSIRHLTPVPAIDGLTTTSAPPPPKPITHPNGATGIDHVVILTPDFGRTADALDRVGLALRRIRHVGGGAGGAGGFRQGFRRIGPAILELVETNDAPAGPASFYGLVVTVGDLDALAERLGDRLGTPRAAVQPGRRLATLKGTAGLAPAVAFMTPEPT